MKSTKYILLALLLVLGGILIPKGTAWASSGSIQFMTETPSPLKGEKVTVVCQVTCPQGFMDTEFVVSYDAKKLKFLEGGSKVTGGNGTLNVASTGNSETVKKMTFAFQFKAIKTGNSLIELDDTASITDADGTQISISSSPLSCQVVSKNEATTQPLVSPTPAADEVKKSTNNKLSSLSFPAVSMEPDFNPAVLEYKVTVDCSTTTLFYDAVTASKKARLSVEGNTNLKEGTNEVVFTVVSEAGQKRKYSIHVTKESQGETNKRTQEEKKKSETTGITFQANKADGSIVLSNSTEFTVLNLEDQNQIPAGYTSTKMSFDGVDVPVYAMENDPDNDFVLMYLKGPDESVGIYQFDRKQKTIQRYTGDMVERVNKNGTTKTDTSSSDSSTVFYV